MTPVEKASLNDQ